MNKEYLNKIQAHKEVLETLPQNNTKNKKIFKEKVSELINQYSEDKMKVLEEIKYRYVKHLQVSPDDNIDKINIKIKETSKKLLLINRYNSSYEKSTLDKILYKLGHYYTIDLENVNNNILEAINIFNKVNIKVNSDSFTYSSYAKIYIEKLLSMDINNKDYLEEFKIFFEQVYWKCPDIINHITLNFKYLYYKHQKEFDNYYNNILKQLNQKNIRREYLDLLIEKDNLKKDSKYLILNSFINNELNINDYTEEKINKIREKLFTNENIKSQDIYSLYHILYEYKQYLSLKYIISDVKALFEVKTKDKGNYRKKKKEIIKKEKSLFSNNHKIQKYINKNNKQKIIYYNNIINNQISELKTNYEELEREYFLEKINSLNESSTVLDIFYLYSSNYNYLIKLTKEKELNIDEELTKLNEIIYYPYLNLINNIRINDDKNISLIINDKYTLYNFNITEDMLEEDNLSELINIVISITNGLLMKKHNINETKIKFIKESIDILK